MLFKVKQSKQKSDKNKKGYKKKAYNEVFYTKSYAKDFDSRQAIGGNEAKAYKSKV